MSVFENNISQIRKYNPILADKIINHIFDENVTFEFAEAESGDTNLLYKGILVHDSSDPQKEAMNIFNQLKDTSESSVTILIGLGLGYLFKRLTLSSKGNIIIYEPNLDFLRFTLEVVDFSQEFASKKVFVANSKTELIKFLDGVYSYQAVLNLAGLGSCHTLYSEFVKDLQLETEKIKNHLESNYLCLFEKSYEWVKEGVKNLPILKQSNNVDVLKNTFRDIPAVVVSSGPSLDETVQTLAKYKDNVIIFAVGNSYKTLAKYGIKPDFINFIEVYDNTNQLKGLDISDINLIAQPIANNNVFKLNWKNKYVFYSNNDIFAKWLAGIADFSIAGYENKGNVSYCAMYSAYMMGCNPIINLGLDLAFTDGKCYSSNSPYSGLKLLKGKKEKNGGKYYVKIEDKEEFLKHYRSDNSALSDEALLTRKRQELMNGLTFVKGQDGGLIPSNINYESFIKFFEQFAYDKSNNTDLKIYNASPGGANINGFDNINPEEKFASMFKINLDIAAMTDKISGIASNPVKDSYDEIKCNIKLMIEDITAFEPLAGEGLDAAECLLSDLARDMREFDLDRIREKASVLIENYVKFHEELFDNNLLLTGCVFKDLTELTRIFENDSGNTGMDDLMAMGNASKTFYTAFLYKVVEFKELLESLYADQKKGSTLGAY